MPALLVIVVIPASALAYRPFVSTDAAVADEKQIEIELGYFNLDRNGELNTITTPSVVLNYGFAKDWEAVGEFQVEQSPDSEVADSGLFVKRVVKEGVLQDKPGVSLAVETGLLLPSTRFRERGVGFEAVGIVSGKVKTFTLHANAGGGLNRDDRHAFGIWGIIGELPLHPGSGWSAKSMARTRKASSRTTQCLSALSGSRRRGTCFSTLAPDMASAVGRRTGSSRLD